MRLDDTQPFPIQSEHDGKHRGTTIPWWLAEIAYRQYAHDFGTDQSLERLAERGGFSREELVTLLRGLNLVGNASCLCPHKRVSPLCRVHRGMESYKLSPR